MCNVYNLLRDLNFCLICFPAEWFCVSLWGEAGIGGPGEDTVLLDFVGIDHKHPHLLHVETIQNSHLLTSATTSKCRWGYCRVLDSNFGDKIEFIRKMKKCPCDYV